MKQKLMHVLIMVLAVAAVVGGVALFSNWVAPKEEAVPPVTAAATSPVQDVPAQNDGAAEDDAAAAPAEETVVDPAEIADMIALSEEENVTVTVQFVPVDDSQTEQPVFTLIDGVSDILLAELMGGADATEATIIGRWQMTPECVAELYGIGDVACTLLLTEDGQFNYTLTVMGYNETHAATYTVDGNTIIVDGTVAEYVLEADRLTIKADGVEQTFTRMK